MPVPQRPVRKANLGHKTEQARSRQEVESASGMDMATSDLALFRRIAWRKQAYNCAQSTTRCEKVESQPEILLQVAVDEAYEPKENDQDLEGPFAVELTLEVHRCHQWRREAASDELELLLLRPPRGAHNDRTSQRAGRAMNKMGLAAVTAHSPRSHHDSALLLPARKPYL